MDAVTPISTSEEVRAVNRDRFEFELEFVQSLANPHYLQSLAQQNILVDSSFVLYLKYLLYWTEPEYARFVVYPHALHHLQLLQNEKFREALKSSDTAQWLSEKQFDHWRTWRAGPVSTVPHTNFLPKSIQSESNKMSADSDGGGTQPLTDGGMDLTTQSGAVPATATTAVANHNHVVAGISGNQSLGTPLSVAGEASPVSR